MLLNRLFSDKADNAHRVARRHNLGVQALRERSAKRALEIAKTDNIEIRLQQARISAAREQAYVDGMF